MPRDSTPSREPPTYRETAPKPDVPPESRCRAFGVREEQRTPPYPRRLHLRRLQTLSSLEPTLPTCHLSLREMDVGRLRSNRAEGGCSQICHLIQSGYRETH